MWQAYASSLFPFSLTLQDGWQTNEAARKEKFEQQIKDLRTYFSEACENIDKESEQEVQNVVSSLSTQNQAL